MANDFKRGIRIYLETSDYGKGIKAMVAATGEYEDKLAELRKEAEKMTASGQNSGKAWDDLQTKIKQNETHLKKSQAAEVQYREKLEQTKKVLNNLSGVSYNELVKVQKQLQKELKDTTRGTEEHKTKLAQLERVNKEVSKSQAEMNSNIGKSGSFFGRAVDGFNKYLGVAATVFAAVTGLTMGIKKFMDMRRELEDSQANLKALTGLGDNDIMWLTEQAKKMSTATDEMGISITATSKEIMDGYTVIGSKRPELLKNKEAMAEVTKQALILAAAGKMEVATAFDVVTAAMNQFNLRADQSNRIINTIAAGSLEGSAEADSLAGSLKNVGTVANDSNMSLEETVATLEVLASKQLMGEEAGTKLRGAILKMKEAGVGYASGLFNFRDALTEINAKLEQQGSQLQRDALLQKVFGAENITAGTILLGNVKAYDELTVAVTGTNVAMNQARINTQTISTKLAQAKNRFNELGMELVSNLNPAMLSATNITNNLIKLLIKHPGVIYTILAGIAALTLVYIANTAAKLKDNIVTNVTILLTKSQNIASLALAAGQAILTGNTIRARAAMKLLREEMALNPYLAMVAVIAALTYGLYKLATSQTAAQKSLKAFNIEAATQQRELNNIFEAYKKANPQTAEKAKLLEIIKEKYGPYIQSLIDEKGNITDIEKAQKLANTALRQAIALKIQNASIDEIATKEIEKQSEILTDIQNFVADKKGKDIAAIIVSEIGRIFTDNSNDLKAAYSEGWKLLNKYGISPVTKKGAFSGSLAGDLRDLYNSFARVNNQTIAIKGVFKGLIGDAETIAATTGSAVPTPKEGDIKGGGGLDEQEQKKILDKKIAALEAEQQAEENLLKQQRLSNKISEEVYLSSILDVNIKYLTKKRDLYAKGSKEYEDLNAKILDIQLNSQKAKNEAILKSIEDSYKSIQDATTIYEQFQRDRLQSLFDDGIISQEQYNSEIAQLDEILAEARLKNAQDYAELIRNATFNTEQDKKKAVDAANAAVAAANDAYFKAKNKRAKNEYADEKARLAEIDKIRQYFGLDKQQESWKKSLKALKDHLKEVKATEEDSAAAIAAFKIGKVQEYAQSAVDISGRIADVISSYHQMEADSLEAQKQKELKAAGDNAEARQAIEEEYAQKELDLKKKQSGADMAIKIVQAIAAGALGVANIWAHHADNPVLAGILTGIETAAVGIQIASLIKQREAIMNTTLDSSGSSDSSSTSSGVRVAQAATGRWDVIGEEDGKVYRNVPYRGVARTGIITAPTLVAEQGDEAIIDNPTLRNIRMNAPWILSVINKMRVPQRASGSYPETVSQSSSGSFSQTTNDTLLTANMEVLKRLVVLLTFLIDNGIDANVYLDKLEKKIALKNKSLKKGSS